MKSTIASTAFLLATLESTFSLPVDGTTATVLEKRMFGNTPSTTSSFGSAPLNPNLNNYGGPSGYNSFPGFNGQSQSDPSFNSQLSNPFGQNGQLSNPFSQNGQSTNPFGQNGQFSNPFGQNGQFSNPFVQNGQYSNPFGQNGQFSNPFVQNGQFSDPSQNDQFSNPVGQSNLFSNPLGSQSQNPTGFNNLGNNLHSGNSNGFTPTGSMFQKSVGDSKHQGAHNKAVEGHSKLEGVPGKTSTPSKRDVGIHHSKGHTKAMAQRHAA